MSEQDGKAEKPILEELTASTAGSNANLEQLMEPADPILKQKGGDLKIYRAIRTDDQVKAVLDQRRSAMIAAEWEVDAGGTDAASVKAADDLREQLKTMKFDDACSKMWESVYYGYKIGECMWSTDGKAIVLAGVKARKNERFKFDLGGRARLLDSTGKGLLLPDQKFWIIRTGAEDDDDPYGLGLAHWLYWPVFFKRQGLSFWLQLLDKLGAPTVWGQHPPTATDPEKKALLAALNSFRRNGSIITPTGVTIELLEATRSSSPDFLSLIKLMNEAISKIVVGQTMTADSGSSRAQAQVHLDVRGDIVKADADLLCESFNSGPVTWLTRWNHPKANPPRVFRRTEAPEDLNSLAERDERLTKTGYRPTLARVSETYGDGYELIPATAAPSTTPAKQPGSDGDDGAAAAAGDDEATQSLAEFADGPARGGDARPGDAVDDLSTQLRGATAARLQAMAQRAESLLAECATLQEFADRLVELYPAAPEAELGEVMAQALSLADLRGRDETASLPEGRMPA